MFILERIIYIVCLGVRHKRNEIFGKITFGVNLAVVKWIASKKNTITDGKKG